MPWFWSKPKPQTSTRRNALITRKTLDPTIIHDVSTKWNLIIKKIPVVVVIERGIQVPYISLVPGGRTYSLNDIISKLRKANADIVENHYSTYKNTPYKPKRYQVDQYNDPFIIFLRSVIEPTNTPFRIRNTKSKKSKTKTKKSKTKTKKSKTKRN